MPRSSSYPRRRYSISNEKLVLKRLKIADATRKELGAWFERHGRPASSINGAIYWLKRHGHIKESTNGVLSITWAGRHA